MVFPLKPPFSYGFPMENLNFQRVSPRHRPRLHGLRQRRGTVHRALSAPGERHQGGEEHGAHHGPGNFNRFFHNNDDNGLILR